MAEELLLTGQRVLPRQLEDEGFDFHYPTVTEVLDDLTRR
jgi:NAD dependent epimerase/dehydratase family enzyme